MNERNLQQFKKQLNTRLADLLRQADQMVRDLQDLDLRQADALDLAATAGKTISFTKFRDP